MKDMVSIGKWNKLTVVKSLDFGVYLDSGDRGEILMPRKYVPENVEIGSELDAFIYFDSEDRIIATTQQPLAQVGEFAYLEVKTVTRVGAFLDWGLPKDLLVPFGEQRGEMKRGNFYLVYVYADPATGRIVASAKLDKFLDNLYPEFSPNQEVDVIVAQETDLGFKVIVNNLFWGILYHNEVFVPLSKGDRKKAYIKQVREDGKIDLMLQPMGYEKIEGMAERVLRTLHNNNGFLAVNDKTSADLIMSYFGCSKKNFKKAIGALYKAHKILITEDGIRETGR